MSYNIITNETEVQNFIDILPDLLPGETYLLRVITRAKYVNSVNTDRDLRMCEVNKSTFLYQLQQFENENFIGLGNDDISVYASLNPRSYALGIKRSLLIFNNLIGNANAVSPIAICYQALRASCSRKKYHDIDFDNVPIFETMEALSAYLNINSGYVLPTKSGFHFIIDMEKLDIETYPNWKTDISHIAGFDSMVSIGDNMIPVPGCNQFGFTPIIQKT